MPVAVPLLDRQPFASLAVTVNTVVTVRVTEMELVVAVSLLQLYVKGSSPLMQLAVSTPGCPAQKLADEAERKSAGGSATEKLTLVLQLFTSEMAALYVPAGRLEVMLFVKEKSPE